MGLFRSTALLAVLCLVALPSPASAQSRTEEALARRVDSLERRVVELEARLAQLERSGPQATSARSTSSTNSQDLANWRQLREDMSYDTVRRILGEPVRIDGGSVAFWSYQNGGQVSFISGRLKSWTEPR